MRHLRKRPLLTVCLLIITSCIPGQAYALGVLEAELKSYINERLVIEIPLTLTEKEKNADIYVNQVPGRERNISEWVPEMKFSLISDADENYSIIAKSRDPVQEPIVHFTISIKTRYNWINKEMSFLLDPRPMEALARTSTPKTKKETVLKPAEARPREPARPSYTPPQEPVTEPITASTSSYMVKSGDSVSLIARKFRDARNASAQQAMVSIFNANPHAFINNDINKIKSHVEIVIPDDAEMKKLSAPEARQVFNMLLAGETAPAKPAPVREVPVAEDDIMPATAPEVSAEPPGAEAVAQAEPETPAPMAGEPVQPQKNYELTLAPDDAGVPETAIKQNQGTIVYETPESIAAKAAAPSADMRENIESAVVDMEQQLTTLRNEIKRLQKTLEDKERKQAATASSIEQMESDLAGQASASTGGREMEAAGPVDIETGVPEQTESDFDFLRLLIEILTLGAAGGFIGYFIALRRKRTSPEPAVEGDSAYIRPIFSTGKAGEVPDEKQSTYAPTPPEHASVGQEGIEVSDANLEEYDDSVSRRAPEPAEEEPVDQPGSEEEFNPEYILQEANLSIAFSDLDNAYHLLMKLINHEPKNPEYRVLILGVLKDLLKEGEFLFHANHLADITEKSPDSAEWQKAVELGQAFLPDHELFAFMDDGSEDITDVNPVLMEGTNVPADDQPTSADNMNQTGTIVLDSRKALAEHERVMREKEGTLPADTDDDNETPETDVAGSESAPLSFDELMDDDDSGRQDPLHEEETQLSPYVPHNEEPRGSDEEPSPETDETQPAPLSFDELMDNDEAPEQPGEDADKIRVYDDDPFATQSGPDATATVPDAPGQAGEDPYKQLEDEIKADSLVPTKKAKPDSEEDDDDTEKTILTKRD